MCRNRVVQVRLTERQYERVILRKEHAGYKTISQFVRNMILKDDLAVYRMISEMYKKICLGK